jgi:RNA-dependent RNA polymerase
MLVKRTRHSTFRGQVKMVLNLDRREIDIRFPSVYSDKTREYKFIIPIDQVFDLSQFQAQNDTKTSFILSLRTPPHFYKKLSGGITSTHDDAAFTWREQDAWLRQTNVLSNKHEVNQLKARPVTLKNHPEGIVNIGRWTTYKITVDDKAIDKEKYRVFKAALRDYNVPIAKAENFEIVHEGKPAWDLLEASLQEYGSTSVASAAGDFPKHSLLDLMGSEENEIYLPFPVRYQLEVCITNGWINEHNLSKEFLETLSRVDRDRATHILECVTLNRLRIFDPMEVFSLRVPRLPSMKSKIPDNCIVIRSAIITPSTMMLNTPYIEMTNRVIRKYKEHADRFLRVRFEDDETRGYARINATSQKTMDEVLSKIFRTLTRGIVIGDRHYEFLAFGNSQLREHGAYFFAALPTGPTASHIRAWMGRFEHERIVAKHAARIGQCFSTTRAIKNAGFPPVRKTNLINDVERNGFTFTDGVGKISRFYAETIAKELRLRGSPPSVYQFRMAGCKGVLAVAPELGATNVKIRESQFKFETSYSGMEIIRWSEYWVATLNRQLILVLSALGVPDEIFLLLQEKEIQLLEHAMIHDSAALEALTGHVDPNGMTLSIAGLIQAGFRRSNEPFVTSVLRLWRAWSIKYLKEKARIPVREGACILGCTDETGTLRGHFDADQVDENEDLETKIAKLPEVFVQITCPRSGNHKVIEGLCVIARNPSLHAGDMRVVKAVDVPALHHLVDVLVLPQTGDRDISSMCSGGDLDGDDYVVIWDERLLPEIWNVKPMDYTPPPPAPLERDVTQTDITKFFVKYMKNDFLPKIALSHLAWADFLDEGVRHEKCLELAQLHSKAVDYPKTGQPAQMPKGLNAKQWPHFMEKKGRNSYRSYKILGQLYDAVDRVAFVPNYDAPFDEGILNACEPDEEIVHAARELKHEYDTSLQRIMAQHDIKTEFEVWSTFVLDHSKASNDYKFHEEIGQLSNSLKEQYHSAVVHQAGGNDWSHLVPWAVAMYRVTKEELEAAKLQGDGAVMPFISFPWILRSTLIQIMKGVDNLRTRLQNEEGKDLLGSIQEPALNPETQMYDDPYQPGTTETGGNMTGNLSNEEIAVAEKHASPGGQVAREADSHLDMTTTTHADAHHIDNGGFPAGTYAADLRPPPQPTGEQFALIEKIIKRRQSSRTSRRTSSYTSAAPEQSQGKLSPAKDFVEGHANDSLLDVSTPRSGFGFPSSHNRSINSNFARSERQLGQSSASRHLSDPFVKNDLVDASEKSSSAGSGVVTDIPQPHQQESYGHYANYAITVALSEDLADLRLGPAAPQSPHRDNHDGSANRPRDLTCRPLRANRDENKFKSHIDNMFTLPEDEPKPARTLTRGDTITLASSDMTRAKAPGQNEADQATQKSSRNLMNDLEDPQARARGMENLEDEEDDGMVFVDPLASSGQNDVDRLRQLGGW